MEGHEVSGSGAKFIQFIPGTGGIDCHVIFAFNPMANRKISAMARQGSE
jgi:hypothetical protein